MKKSILAIFAAALLMLAPTCRKESSLRVKLPEKFEGKTAQLMNYLDSTAMDTAVVRDGYAEFTITDRDALAEGRLMAVAVDGRMKGYYIAEEGRAEIGDSTSTAKGTPLNDRFSALVSSLDSIEDLDDMAAYTRYSLEQYNANKDNAIGDFFGVEWLKFAEPASVDSLLKLAPERFRESTRVRHYASFARHRASTAPGMKYTDFAGESKDGKKMMLSQLVTPGKYTLVDFWASWCPYCIKELPELKQLLSDFGSKGFEIVGVAVRDLPEDTKEMMKKKEIGWGVLYNTQKVPYEIYGFSGIPHHMLIGPDGIIISRGENADAIRKRLESSIKSE